MDAFVVADAHGNLDAVAGLLRQAGILDDEWERVDRETYVVQVGDLCNCVAASLVDARCNNAIGHAGEDPERLRALADYIERTPCLVA